MLSVPMRPVSTMAGGASTGYDAGARSAAASLGGSDAVRTTPTALHLTDDLSLDAWQRVGANLCLVQRASAWWVGDWLTYGEQRYGRRYKEATELTGLDYQTLRNYAWVASRYPLSRRRDVLSFQHHAEVASLPAQEQELWLSMAADLGWSRNEMRRRLRADRSRFRRARIVGGDERVTLEVTVASTTHARWLETARRTSDSLEDWIVKTLEDACGYVSACDAA